MRIGGAAIAAGVMVAATTVAAPAGAGDDGIAVRVSQGDAFSSKYSTTVWVNKSVEGWPARVTLRQGKTVEVMKPHQSVQLKTGRWRGRLTVHLPDTKAASSWRTSGCEFVVSGTTDWVPYVDPDYAILPHRERTISGTVSCADEVLGSVVKYGAPLTYAQREYLSDDAWVAAPGNESWGLGWWSLQLARQSPVAQVDRRFRFTVRPRNYPTASPAESRAMRLGMTLPEVARIIGSKGRLVTKSTGGYLVRSFETYGNRPSLLLEFTHGRVTGIHR